MTRVDGSLARKLDFTGRGANTDAAAASGRCSMRLAQVPRMSGANKYRMLDVRRRRAQIAARHLLDLIDAQEASR